MNRDFLQLRVNRILLSIIAVFLLLGISHNAWSQNFTYPQVPKLSLTGALEGYNKDWYPDGRIWLPVSQNGGEPREFLMPVFIDNKWWHYKSTDLGKYLVPDPIYSFRFKILYDGVALTPVDIVTTHPFPEGDARGENTQGEFEQPLAKNFEITWSVHKDMTYHEYFLEPGDPPIPLSTRQKGRVIVISGISSQPLPVTDTNQRDAFQVLLYVKFRVNLEEGNISAEERPSLFSPIYISPDTIMYNDWNVRTEIAFKNLLNSPYVRITDLYPDPKAVPFVGMDGMNNKTVTSLWNTQPILPGTIYLQLTEALPRIWYDLSRSGSQPPMWDWENNSNEAEIGSWILRDPLTVDSSQLYEPYYYGTLTMQILNSTSETRLLDLWVESDAPWLKFDLVSLDRTKINQISSTQAYCYYIDNAILGQGANKPDPMGNETQPDEIVQLVIKCDPSAVTPHNGEQAGIYTGYITFRSHTAAISPVRMKITFINYRNPFEPDDGKNEKPHKGITLTLRNSRGATGDETKLVFGLGHRATDKVDSLFGEFPYPGAKTGFGARFYHPNQEYANENGFPFGFGDMVPNRDNPYSESRDIRDINDTSFSHIFLVRFNANGAANYPVVIEWDTTEFPDGAQLFISDTLNGELFPSQNMRSGTHVTGNILSYSIQDPKIVSFKIEYTPQRVVNYVDPNGQPKIKKGWNLVSLPVRPKNTLYNVVYPNVMNKPYNFFNNGYQEQDLLKVGVGYFVKYSDKIDTKFKGTPMARITVDKDDDGYSDQVLLYEGWNTIGSLSYPMNVSYIAFDERDGQTPKPTVAYVRKHGIWGYKTNVGYYETSILEPGWGYWLKVDPLKSGYLKLVYPEVGRLVASENNEKGSILNSSTRLSIIDNAQHSTNLYLTNLNVDVEYFELPPVPPAGLFDARFYNNTMLANGQSSVINLQGIEYPLMITVTNADANYVFEDAVTGEVLGTVKKGENNSVEIKSTANNSIRVLKTEVASDLSVEAYPNPVAATSTIKYVVPVDGFVTVNLYDGLGNRKVLYQGFRAAGVYTLDLNAAELSSGSYMCKVVSGMNSSSVMINVVK